MVPTGKGGQRRTVGDRDARTSWLGPPADQAGSAGGAAPAADRSRAELARTSGLPYQGRRTYTDGLWTADHLPPVRVLAALSQAFDPTELQRAVREAMLARTRQSHGSPSLTRGQRVLLEALRGFDDDIMIEAARHVHNLHNLRRRSGAPRGRCAGATRPASRGTGLTPTKAVRIGEVRGARPTCAARADLASQHTQHRQAPSRPARRYGGRAGANDHRRRYLVT